METPTLPPRRAAPAPPAFGPARCSSDGRRCPRRTTARPLPRLGTRSSRCAFAARSRPRARRSRRTRRRDASVAPIAASPPRSTARVPPARRGGREARGVPGARPRRPRGLGRVAPPSARRRTPSRGNVLPRVRARKRRRVVVPPPRRPAGFARGRRRPLDARSRGGDARRSVVDRDAPPPIDRREARAPRRASTPRGDAPTRVARDGRSPRLSATPPAGGARNARESA